MSHNRLLYSCTAKSVRDSLLIDSYKELVQDVDMQKQEAINVMDAVV